jgi:hypothetical protein
MTVCLKKCKHGRIRRSTVKENMPEQRQLILREYQGPKMIARNGKTETVENGNE